ncbi:hypothetical protein [Demequina zhanjiangensis]|uniref:Uncharacterized protein n=1 Tax=Demequina zhanjiangensis TaxID=3051659 RepID=A0ABT8FXK0_9MICO|nr:hypothetical protein [Demequina sp. SYSU T00b26]MDN4471630.1 hypothetical protein [Demequina sp. SYSU T00b26]
MTSAVPSTMIVRAGDRAESARGRTAELPVEHPRALRRGTLLAMSVTLPLAVAASAVSYLMASQQRSIVVAIGLAAGASMATQVVHRCRRAGLRAVAIGLVASALAVIGMQLGVLAAEPGPFWPALVDHASIAGLTDIAHTYVDGEPVRAGLSIGAALLLAYLTGRGLGACRFERRAAEALNRH